MNYIVWTIGMVILWGILITNWVYGTDISLGYQECDYCLDNSNGEGYACNCEEKIEHKDLVSSWYTLPGMVLLVMSWFMGDKK